MRTRSGSPARDIDVIAEPSNIEIDLERINQTTRAIVIAGLGLSSHLYAMHKTIERFQRAREAEEENLVRVQENHLVYLASSAALLAGTVLKGVLEINALVPKNLMMKRDVVADRVGAELEKDFSRLFLRQTVQQGLVDEDTLREGVGTLLKSIERLPWEEKLASEILKEFEFEMTRFSQSLLPPRALAQAA